MEGHNSHQILMEGITPDNSCSSSESVISISLSREDILAVYEEGPEAVVSLVQTLCSIIIVNLLAFCIKKSFYPGL